MTTPRPGDSRRAFLGKTAAATLFVAGLDLAAVASDPVSAWVSTHPDKRIPWYRRTLRWGQTNITEIDAERYDVSWWRQHWKRTQVQGVLINAGGIYASYPSKFPLHYRAPQLHDRDLYGELARAAHDDGLVVLARMDSNRVREEFYRAHPDWFAIDVDGKPYRNSEFYIPCVNSPYYDEWIPGLLAEIIERTHPEGFGDNNWNGLERDKICYCDRCKSKFEQWGKHEIPAVKNWDDPVYRDWIMWNYARRTEIWDINNRAARQAGGPDCLWIGMNSGSLPYQGLRFRDYRAICKRAELFLLDDQMRNDASGFQHNAEIGALIHEMLGWDKLIPESMAMYQMGRPPFRLASKPEPEARLWMLEGIAGGLQPWYHHLGAYQEDRRMFKTAEPILRWHRDHEQYLVNRRPVANVGLVWSQQNTDFFGRDDADELTELPWRGWTNALVRARIPYVPVHLDDIGRDPGRFKVLILPNSAAMSDAQADAIRKFVETGGGLIATGAASRCDEWGDPRPDFALGDLFGAHCTVPQSPPAERGTVETAHTYLRLHPDVGQDVYGPRTGKEPVKSAPRHPALAGFDETNILPFGGTVVPVRVDPGATVLATFIPALPVFPPEQVWIHQITDHAGVIINARRGRVAYLPADIDRWYARNNLPDHAILMANLVRWAADNDLPLGIEGAGFVDCRLYHQQNRLVLHVVNLTNEGTWRGPIDEWIRIGPLDIRVRPMGGIPGKHVNLLVTGSKLKSRLHEGWITFEIPTVLDHEVAVIS